MPKERRIHRQYRASPLKPDTYRRHKNSSPSFQSPLMSGHHKHPSSSTFQDLPVPPSAEAKVVEEWEEVRCPVCMEHPHNAVLLKCSSHEKGCRAFMCDTSYRHSNCLDKYCKAFSQSPPPQEGSGSQPPTKLACPLCRGQVTRFTVVEHARRYMNAKIRSCSLESCRFSGNYKELRKHARKEHPFLRPSEVDPERQHDWQRMEQQQDLGDMLSTLNSSNPGEEAADRAELPYPSTSMWLVNHDGRSGIRQTIRSITLLRRTSGPDRRFVRTEDGVIRLLEYMRYNTMIMSIIIAQMALL